MKVGFKNLDTNEVIQEWVLNPAQERFWKNTAKFLLFSGGYGSGKSLMLTLKAVELASKYPNNFILMGRKTYPELRDSLLKEFFNYCPSDYIKEYLKAEGRVIFHNGSEIIFRHLDTVSEMEIKSMNLGAAFIDQAEEIAEEVFQGLRGRLRRNGVDDKDRRIFMTCNPALTWLYATFKQTQSPDYAVVESSTLDNAANLSEGYLKDLLAYPEAYKRQYVYGVWDESLLSDRVVFAREHLERMRLDLREPLREQEGLQIFAEYVPGHQYQIGIDSSEGIVEVGVAQAKQKSDESVIFITDLTLEEEAASWSGRLPPDIVAERTIQFANWYADKKNPILLVPEMNSIGLALVNRLNREVSDVIRIYHREEFDKRTGARQEKEGFRTTRQTKPLLASRMQELMRKRHPKIRSHATYDQFRSFVWTDVAQKQGMGAEEGFHDDRVIACLLSFWQKRPVEEANVSSPKTPEDPLWHGATIRDGKIHLPALALGNGKRNNWTAT